MQLTFKIQNTDLETTPNDTTITMTSYLVDSNGYAFLNSQNQIDTFDVITYASSLPVTGVDSYLSIVAGTTINAKYNQNEQTIGGDLRDNNDIIMNLAGLSETETMPPGLIVTGANIPSDTTIIRFRDSETAEMSQDATGTGNSELTFSTAGWVIDYAEITRLTTIINFGVL